MDKRLHLSRKNKIVAGVCGGIAEYLGVDPNLIRIIFALLVLLGGGGIILYIIAWILMPPPSEFEDFE
jgi:phage shock protein C